MNDRFDLRLKIECPVSAEGDRKRELMLMGPSSAGRAGNLILFFFSRSALAGAGSSRRREFAARYEARRNEPNLDPA
ncbi:MAG: hypothetical protein R3F11_21170 [Verrucomicrobiales bacterium]